MTDYAESVAALRTCLPQLAEEIAGFGTLEVGMVLTAKARRPWWRRMQTRMARRSHGLPALQNRQAMTAAVSAPASRQQRRCPPNPRKDASARIAERVPFSTDSTKADAL